MIPAASETGGRLPSKIQYFGSGEDGISWVVDTIPSMQLAFLEGDFARARAEARVALLRADYRRAEKSPIWIYYPGTPVPEIIPSRAETDH